MTRMKEIKLARCKVCARQPRMVKIQLIDGMTLLRKDKRVCWWYQVECSSFHHQVKVHHRDRMVVADVWNDINGGVKEG